MNTGQKCIQDEYNLKTTNIMLICLLKWNIISQIAKTIITIVVFNVLNQYLQCHNNYLNCFNAYICHRAEIGNETELAESIQQITATPFCFLLHDGSCDSQSTFRLLGSNRYNFHRETKVELNPTFAARRK